MLKLIQSEPVAFAAVVQAFVALMTTFGLHLSVEQAGAINALSAAVLAVIVRGAVVPMGGKA